MNELRQAIKAGRKTWATVLRSQSIKLVPGDKAKEGELLSWTYEGADRWFSVARVVKRFINPVVTKGAT